MKLRVNIKEIFVSKIKPNPWNPNVQSDFIFEKERESIREHGFIDPILVRGKGKGYEVIDGEHRLRAAIAEGYDKIPCNDLGTVSDAVAWELTVVTNEVRGKADPQKLQELLKNLNKEIGFEKLVNAIPMQRVELESIIANASVDWDKISPTLVGPSMVVGMNSTPFGEPERTQKSAVPPEQIDINKKTITLTVSLKTHAAFVSQLNRINKEIHGPKDDFDMAVQIISDLLSKLDNVALTKGLKGFVKLRKGPKKS